MDAVVCEETFLLREVKETSVRQARLRGCLAWVGSPSVLKSHGQRMKRLTHIHITGLRDEHRSE